MPDPRPPATNDADPVWAAVAPAWGAAVAAVGAGLAGGLLLWLWTGAGVLLAVALALAAGAAAWHALDRPAPMPAAPPLPESDAPLRDARTGMFHRPAFLALAERDWMRAGRYGGAVGLLLIEVDRLRAMTDRSGPNVADVLLGGLGRQVGASLRGADLLARFDDAQLAVFLPQADPTGALDVADRIRETVHKLSLPGLPPSAEFSASIGVSVLRPLHQPLSALVADAQQALQAARRAGGNCVRLAPADALPPTPPGRWADGDTTRPPARGSDA